MNKIPLLLFLTCIILHSTQGQHGTQSPVKDSTSSLEEQTLVIQMKRVIQSVNKFSNRLYNVMNEYKPALDSGEDSQDEPSSEDLVYSPVTIFTSLATLRDGAAKDTAEENPPTYARRRHIFLNESVLENGLNIVLEPIEPPSDRPSLNIINRLFLDHSYHPNEEYVNRVTDKFSGELVQAHFSNASAATTFVNEHMYSASHGILQEILAEHEDTTEMIDVNGTHIPSPVSIDGGLMLVSGLMIEGDWDRGFTPLLTKRRKFTREDGTPVDVDMMHRDGLYYYAEIPELNASAVSIPYKTHRYSFTVILPEEGTKLAEVEENLESFPFSAVLSRMSKQHIQLSLPKFRVETTVDLIEPLEQLGIKRVFREESADLSGIAKSSEGLYLTNAVHKSFLDVSEGGSRVPSANFIEAVPVMSRHLTPFMVNRPFVFFISDQLLQTTVLVGRKAL